MSGGTFTLIFALVALALIAAYLILKPNDRREIHLERRHNAPDRRHASLPMAYERRRGVVDRRLGPPAMLPGG